MMTKSAQEKLLRKIEVEDWYPGTGKSYENWQESQD
jgi:hypothetical protein